LGNSLPQRNGATAYRANTSPQSCGVVTLSPLWPAVSPVVKIGERGLER
jgi:hypothetical protein